MAWVQLLGLREGRSELDAHGHPKIIPMSANGQFSVSSGRDPRDLPVEAGDGAIVGKFPICGWMSLNNSFDI